MSMFLCQRCDQFSDSDDGCEEGDPKRGSGLICIDCMADMEDEPEPKRDMSYEGIVRGLLALGCPEDIARELAREKSRD